MLAPFCDCSSLCVECTGLRLPVGKFTSRRNRPVSLMSASHWVAEQGRAVRQVAAWTQTGLTEISQSQTLKSYLAVREHERKYSGRRHRTGNTRLCVISDPRRRRERFGLFRDANGRGAEVSCGNGVKEGAHVGSALGSERLLELPLRLHPSFNPGPARQVSPLTQRCRPNIPPRNS